MWECVHGVKQPLVGVLSSLNNAFYKKQEKPTFLPHFLLTERAAYLTKPYFIPTGLWRYRVVKQCGC